MRLTWQPKRFPDFTEADEFGCLYDADGKEINLYVVAFDLITGEVWVQVHDAMNIPMEMNGELILHPTRFKPPLEWVPHGKRRG